MPKERILSTDECRSWIQKDFASVMHHNVTVRLKWPTKMPLFNKVRIETEYQQYLSAINWCVSFATDSMSFRKAYVHNVEADALLARELQETDLQVDERDRKRQQGLVKRDDCHVLLIAEFDRLESYLDATYDGLYGWAKDMITQMMNVAQYPQLKEALITINRVGPVGKDSIRIDYTLEAHDTQLLDLAQKNIDSADKNFAFPVDHVAIYAKNKPYFNKLFGIKPGAKMDIDHILAVVLYTDTYELQKYFKQQTRKMNYNEHTETVATRNSKYAHW
eukprot:494037_1